MHQIEMQMQNETLTETLVQCESLRMKYLDLYDFAPVSYHTLDTMGVVVKFSRACRPRQSGAKNPGGSDGPDPIGASR